MSLIDNIRQIDFSNPKTLLKLFFGVIALMVIVIIAIYFVMFAVSIVASPFGNTTRDIGGGYYASESTAPMKMAYDYEESMDASFSARNLVPPMPGGSSIGYDAEDFEVTSYSANYRNGNVSETCDSIERLKPLSHVIFENSNRHDSNCRYSFKVEKDYAVEVLATLEALDPEEIVENITSIQLTVEGYADQIDILDKKLSSIEATLEEAQLAYSDVQKLATRTQDVESLAKIIDSKVSLIERLTQQRISVAQQIDHLSKQKAMHLDRLAFTFFNVYVYEQKLVDFEAIKATWVYEVQKFTREINQLAQGVTLQLALFLAKFVVATVFFFVGLFLAKYAWRYTVKIWKA